MTARRGVCSLLAPAPRRVALAALIVALTTLAGVGLEGVPAGAQPTPLFVSSSGSDTGSCNDPSTPCATVTYALTQSDPANRIDVNGIIDDNVAISQDVTITGANASFTTSPAEIDGQDLGTDVSVASGVDVTLEDLTITDGLDNNGGGVDNLGSLDIYNSTIAGNSAGAGSGGGILNNGVLNITDSTVEGNTAFNGAGILSFSSGNTGSILDSTIADNTATAANPGFGGGLWYSNGTVSIGGTIIEDNGADGDCATAVNLPTDLGYNLTDDSTCGFSTGDNDVLANTPLSSIGRYGGPTSTMVPSPGGSAVGVVPASETTLCSGADQRGFARPGLGETACTIGAVEVSALAPTLGTSSASVDTAVPITYTATVSGPSGGPTPTGTVNFYDGASAISCVGGDQTLAGTLNTSSATCTMRYATTVGSPRSVTALYVPGSDENYAAGSASSAELVTVSASPASTSPTTTTTGVVLLAQAALTVTSIKGVVGRGLTLATTGGSGSGALSFAVRSGTAGACIVTGSVVRVTRAGTCVVAATKASDGTFAAASSTATTVTFANPPRPGSLVVSFAPGSTVLRGVARAGLSSLARRLIGGATVSIRGYAGNNRALARSRASVVERFLRAHVRVRTSIVLVTATRRSIAKVLTLRQ